MKYIKPVFAVILSVMLCVAFTNVAIAAIMTFETQYDYSVPNKSWLTDLTVKESLTGVSDMVTDLTLVAQPDYPYTETAESFEKDVNEACKLYDLNEGSVRAAYIYLFDVLNDNSAFIEDETSDEDIKDYLVNAGIVYPDNYDADTLVMARALYTIMKSGSLDKYLSDGSIPAGTALETAVVNYMSVFTGIDMSAVQEWTVVSDQLSLDEYLLAVSKYTLWSSGYDVSLDMDEEEVYRLIALMTIRKQGVSAPDDISFDEIKIRYLATMLGTKYDVSCDAAELANAMQSNSVAFYLLQLMGKDAQLSLQPDSIAYEDAFMRVAENTNRFDLEVGEFFADVSDYTTTLKYKRSSVWLYPTSYVCHNENTAQNITITANGVEIEDGNFNEIPVDISKNSDLITIRCSYKDSFETSESVYYLTVKQGVLSPDSVLIEQPELDDLLSGDYEIDDSLLSDTFIPNNTDFVGSVLGSIGLGVGFGDLLDSISAPNVSDTSITGSLNSILPSVSVDPNAFSSLLNSGNMTVLPSIGTVGNSVTGPIDTSITMSVNSMELFSSVAHTDRTNSVLSGIGGLELYSVAETIGTALNGSSESTDNNGSLNGNSAVLDMIFEGGQSVLGAGIAALTSGDSNQEYIAAMTDKAVDVYSNGDGNAVSAVVLDDYLSHQNADAQNLSQTVVDSQQTESTGDRSNKYATMALISACLAVAAGIVLIVTSKQRKVTY